MRTSIQLPEPILAPVEQLAHEMGVQPNQIVLLAIERFVSDEKDRRLFDQINSACLDEPQSDLDQSRLKQIRRQQPRYTCTCSAGASVRAIRVPSLFESCITTAVVG